MWDKLTLFGEYSLGSVKISLFNVLLGIVLFLMGIFLGVVVKKLLKKAAERTNLQKIIKPNFLDISFDVIKWCIYLMFLNIALNQLNIPQLLSRYVSFLVLLPAFVGSLLIIVFGFCLSVYLRNLVKDIHITEGKILGDILFYFVNFVFIVFAIRIVFVSFDRLVVNGIIMVFAVAFCVSAAYLNAQRNLQRK